MLGRSSGLHPTGTNSCSERQDLIAGEYITRCADRLAHWTEKNVHSRRTAISQQAGKLSETSTLAFSWPHIKNTSLREMRICVDSISNVIEWSVIIYRDHFPTEQKAQRLRKKGDRRRKTMHRTHIQRPKHFRKQADIKISTDINTRQTYKVCWLKNTKRRRTQFIHADKDQNKSGNERTETQQQT